MLLSILCFNFSSDWISLHRIITTATVLQQWSYTHVSFHQPPVSPFPLAWSVFSQLSCLSCLALAFSHVFFSSLVCIMMAKLFSPVHLVCVPTQLFARFPSVSPRKLDLLSWNGMDLSNVLRYPRLLPVMPFLMSQLWIPVALPNSSVSFSQIW